jgi:hypothetical protein
MASTKRVSITIVDSRRWRWVRVTINFAVMSIAPIGLGIYLQSAAMQWLGFVFSILGIFTMTANVVKKFDDIEEAKKYLDGIKEPD